MSNYGRGKDGKPINLVAFAERFARQLRRRSYADKVALMRQLWSEDRTLHALVQQRLLAMKHEG